MATILTIQHSRLGTPGRLGATLRDHGFRLDLRTPAMPGGRGLPPDLDNVHGLLCLGGPQNVDEPHPWMEGERALIREAHRRGMPVVGICLGHQLIAETLGGRVERMSQPEVGYQRVDLTGEGRGDSILAGVAWSSHQFQSHAYEVTTPPPGAAVLATSRACKVQAMRVGMRTYGFQYHLEFDRRTMDAMVAADPEFYARGGLTPEVLAKQAEEHDEMFSRLADRVCVNLATLAFTYDELLAV